ncbi:MAG TPA: hypothetical protein VGV59_04640 [Pyrinomonadaceae bacterium]|nr:hypothetical protein [Pyrinomonadaceae bacterium]
MPEDDELNAAQATRRVKPSTPEEGIDYELAAAATPEVAKQWLQIRKEFLAQEAERTAWLRRLISLGAILAFILIIILVYTRAGAG